MRPIAVRILLPPGTAAPGSPTGWLERARAASAARHHEAFTDLGALDVRIVSDPPDGRSFGARLRGLAGEAIAASRGRQVGFVVLGGGSMPLARREDRQAFLATAAARATRALANNFYSADAVAVSDARLLVEVPDLAADNALPRWLAEHAGVPVADFRERGRLGFDIDSPLDALLLARDQGCPPELAALGAEIADANPQVVAALAGIAAVVADRRAEVLVAGRTSPRALLSLERVAACRIRALLEERGLRASSGLALGDRDPDDEPGAHVDESPGAPGPLIDPMHLRPPRSVLGMVLDTRGPDALGEIAAELADAAMIDSRVLLAHRLGGDEAAWPPLADRLASDLLRADEIEDPWLRALTASAARARIPILLGGHTLVGPGLPLIGRAG